MENDVINVSQPDGKKLTVRKVLPVVWLALCTALFIYAFVYMVLHIRDYIDTYDLLHTDSLHELGVTHDIDEQLINRIVAQVAHIILFATAAVFLVPKIISAFRPPKTVRVTGGASVKRKIFIAVWIALCIAAFIFLLVWAIDRIQNWSHSVTIYQQSYDYIYGLLTGDTEADASIIQSLTQYSEAIPAAKKELAKYIIQLVFSIILYLPLAVLFIPKVKAAFLPRKKEDNI